MLCYMCNEKELVLSTEVLRGYCDACQREVRTVFDKDAYALGQYRDIDGSTHLGGVNTLDWTNYIDREEY